MTYCAPRSLEIFDDSEKIEKMLIGKTILGK